MTPRTSAPEGRSTRRGPREERDALRRRRLLDAGLEVFGTEGYAASSIPGLCSTAGVGTTSFYADFPTKEDLLLAVYAEVIERIGGALAAQLERPVTDLEEHVGEAVRGFVAAATRDPRSARVQLVEVVGVSPRVERRRREVIGAFAEVLEGLSERYAAAGHVPRPIDRTAGLAVVGAANELLVEWAIGDGDHRPEPDAIARTMVTVTLGVLRG